MASYLGTSFGDSLRGEDGADTLFGGAGADTLTGGEGPDLFVVADGDSSAIQGFGAGGATADVITDFTADDRLVFPGTQPFDDQALYAAVADDYDAALGLALDAFQNGYEFASIKVGSDVFVFAPRTDAVVKLEGVDPGTVSLSNVSPDMVDGESATLSASADTYDGSAGADTVYGMDGDDVLRGGDGGDRIYAGADNDTVNGGEGANLVRGEAGDDMISTGAQHDDINGNTGRDTITAGGGDDWVHGGKDDDRLLGGEGNDLLFGDLGDDVVGGGLGDDLLHGGEGQDVLRGDDGADTLIGDAGRDTLDGGLGADIYVAQADGGEDRVIYFNADEGDRVMIEPGVAYTLTQDGADTIIDMGAGRMILENVQLSTLPGGWLIEG